MNIDNRLHFPSTERNRYAIKEVLGRYISAGGLYLEVASGSGEHGVFFQNNFPTVIWQTSDPELIHRKSIISWINYQGLFSKMPKPLNLDVENRPWPLSKQIKSSIKGIVCINMIHITPWTCTTALFEESKNYLDQNNFLMIYGPFLTRKTKTSESNKNFDQVLKLKNPRWGLRYLEDIDNLALENGYRQDNIIEMPANNYSVIYCQN
tara:strand:+ start:151 stop:774 length:624 start_codon:yes stop_codon:yes gene_type:complete